MEVAYTNRILFTTAILSWLNLTVFLIVDMLEDSKGITLLSENMRVIVALVTSLLVISVSVTLFIIETRGRKKEVKYE